MLQNLRGFSLQQILLKPSIFSFDLKVLLYFVFRSLFTHFFLFLWSINYNYASQCNKSSTPSLSIWFWLKIWFFTFPWNYGVTHGHILWAPSRTSEWRTTFGVICRFNINATSLWWRSWTSRGLEVEPLELGTIVFLRTLAPWWFCCKSTSLLVMNLKPSMKVITKLKTLLFSHGL